MLVLPSLRISLKLRSRVVIDLHSRMAAGTSVSLQWFSDSTYIGMVVG